MEDQTGASTLFCQMMRSVTPSASGVKATNGQPYAEMPAGEADEVVALLLSIASPLQQEYHCFHPCLFDS